jgi:predicted aspartyl protease
VIDVTFNGTKTFEMIVDTGASATLITRSMAAALGVVPVNTIKVDTASSAGVKFPVGYVQSIAVDGAVANQVLVAIALSDGDIGLLGHDFFGNYDVTLKQNVVEFRRR